MRISFLLTLILLSGCVTARPPAVQPPPPDARLGASPDAVWAALTMVYTDLNIPIQNMDRSSWFLRSAEVMHSARRGGGAAEAYFDCGSAPDRNGRQAPIATTNDVRYAVTTLLIPADGGTMVRHRINAAAVYPKTLATSECYSRGVLEERITEALRERLPGSASGEG